MQSSDEFLMQGVEEGIANEEFTMSEVSPDLLVPYIEP